MLAFATSADLGLNSFVTFADYRCPGADCDAYIDGKLCNKILDGTPELGIYLEVRLLLLKHIATSAECKSA